MRKQTKKVLSLMVASTMVLSLVGCNSKPTTTVEKPATETTTTSTTNEVASSSTTINSSLLQKINSLNSGVSETYNEPMYQLDEDYVFVFDASEKVSSIAYKAFKVFDDPNFEDRYGVSYASCTYKDGKLYVSPTSAIQLTDTSSTYVSGTWGSLNKLYLVQNIDLETGEELANPIVTPFSIKHKVDAPVISQSVDENNLYQITWSSVPNAVEYRVYENYGTSGYKLEATTTNTSVGVEEFATQKKRNDYSDLVKNDLENMGYSIEEGTYTTMNSGVLYTDDWDGYFLVVAVDANGNLSGISNVVDVRDIAAQLPYKVSGNITQEITDVSDAPTYVDVEMLDGSISPMLINYHGAQTYKYTDNSNKITIAAHVYNTLFDNFLITLTGVDYDEFIANASQISNRQDELVLSGGSATPSLAISTTPTTSSESNEEVDKGVTTATTDYPVETTKTTEETSEGNKGEASTPTNTTSQPSTPSGETANTPVVEEQPAVQPSSEEAASNNEGTISTPNNNETTQPSTPSGETTNTPIVEEQPVVQPSCEEAASNNEGTISTPSNSETTQPSTPNGETANTPVVEEQPVVQPSCEETPQESMVEESSVEEIVEEPSNSEVTEPTQNNVETSKEEDTSRMTSYGYTVYEVYLSYVLMVEDKLEELGDYEDVFYANNNLEAWIGYSLLAQETIIPVPTYVFPEAANDDYLMRVFVEAYRQNPTCGYIDDLLWNSDIEALVVVYGEDTDARFAKEKKELAAAKQIASSITNSSMSDAEKVFAINDYLCDNATYDYDSTSTSASAATLSESFLDAHTPYGILCNNLGVCESYAESFALIARYAGLDTIMEIGTLQGGGHEWNRVKVDNSWCIVDATNNDRDICKNAFVNVSDSQVSGLLIPDSYPGYMGTYAATDETKEYYYVKNLMATTSDEAASILLDELNSKDVAQIRITFDLDQDGVRNICQKLYSNGLELNNMYSAYNILYLD